jgi:CPA2 family monovalent cation:H+ antiporter-2
MLASHALALVGVPVRRVLRIVQGQRDARYNLLRGYFHGADDTSADELHQERLSSLTLPLGARCIGKPVSQLDQGEGGVRIVSLRRRGGKVVSIAQDPVIEDGDTLVLSGMTESLAMAELQLLKG